MPKTTFQEAFARWEFGNVPWQTFPMPWASTVFGWPSPEEVGFSRARPEQLEALWIDTWAVDLEVETQVEEQKVKTLTEDDFFSDIIKIQEAKWIDFDTAYDDVLNYYKAKGLTIKGVDIDAELGIVPEEEWATFIEAVEEKSPFLATAFRWLWELWKVPWVSQAIEQLKPEISEFEVIAWATGVEAIANVVDVFVPWDDISKKGTEIKESIEKAMWIDPDATTTKIQEWLTQFWLALTPTPLWKLQLVDKFWKVVKASPKVLSWIKSITDWIVTSWKFEAIAEWEIEKETLAVWAITWVVFKWIWDLIKTTDPAKILRKITWLKPTQLKKLWVTTTKEDAKIVIDSIKKTWLKPKTREELLSVLTKRQQDIYNKDILPLLKKAWESGKVKLTWLTDDILKKIEPEIAWIKLWPWAWIKDEGYEDMLKLWKQLEKKDLSFQQVEEMKKFVWWVLREWWISWRTRPFLNELNTRLGNQLDDLLDKAVWSWVKDLKREYAAIANVKEPLFAKVAQEMRDSWLDIVSQFWLFSALQQAARWEITAATKTWLTIKILEKLRDPNTELNRMVKILYWENNPLLTKSLEKLWIIGVSQVWDEINK